jgi:hypothetical protein
MKEVSFKAPWSAPLVLMTAACTVVCLLLPLPGVMIVHVSSATLRALGMSVIPPWAGWPLIVLPPLIVVISAAFMVRGYVLTDTSLFIKRPGWKTRLDLSRLNSVVVDPDALHGSFRLLGNGGFFSFTGWFRNKKLGGYRAFATDAKRAVVLRFADKTVVITPGDPQKFADEINANKKTAA